MHEEVIISGFGGQGVLFAGQLLAYAGLKEGRHVTWIPSYGPEMRGGTAHCMVVISDDEIGSPLVSSPTILVALNLPSMQRYAPRVKPGGVLVVDSSLVTERSGRGDVFEVRVPAKDIAEKLHFSQVANMVALGVLSAATGAVTLSTLERVLEDHLSERHRDALQANRLALRRGAKLADLSGPTVSSKLTCAPWPPYAT